jgi:hypothetical protein
MRQQNNTITEDMRRCAKMCHECKDACLELVPHCLGMGGAHAEAGHITLLLDCAQICNTAEEFMHRGSPMHARTCGVCAEVCTRCAEDCEQLADGDRQMQKCAELCRQCAESCEQMAHQSA